MTTKCQLLGYLTDADSSEGTLYDLKNPARDETGHQIVSQLTAGFHGAHQYDLINSAIWGQTVSGTAQITVNHQKAQLSVSSNSDIAELSSIRYVRYYNGYTSVIMFTGIFPDLSGQPVFAKAGQFDSLDGYYFKADNNGLNVAFMHNGSETLINQSSWNGDKCDGTGVSEFTLNPQLNNLYKIEFLWLGVGNIRFFVYDPDNGFLLTHTVKYANANLDTTTHNPSLPARYYIEATGAILSTYTIESASIMLASYNHNPRILGPVFSFTNTITVTSTTPQHLFTLKARDLINSKQNRAMSYLRKLTYATDGNKNILIKLILNATLTSPSYTNISTNSSVIEYDTSATVSGGRVLFQLPLGKVASDIVDLIDLDLFISPINTGQTITLTAESISGTSSTETNVSLYWVEDV